MLFYNNKRCSCWLYASCLVLWSASVNCRYIYQDFDLETSAAEPRPIFVENVSPAEALPLVSNVGDDSGPVIGASEKVEKVLQPALTFSYNDKEEDEFAAESKQTDQHPETVDYYKYLQSEVEKGQHPSGTDEQVDVGGQSAESQHEEHHEEDDNATEGSHKHEHSKGKDGHGGGGGHGGKFEKGGGKQHHAHHFGEHGEKGDKGYKGHHHHEKGKKGHHDKEHHEKEYEEKGGKNKKHHHEDGYHGEKYKEHHGKKGTKYGEKGEHSKGHSTKGSHGIHKKDEYEKKTEFFEEDYEDGHQEKHGGFSHSSEFEKGGHKKGGHKKGGSLDEHHGKKGEASKGSFFKDQKGHNEKGGHDHHHHHDSKYGKKESASKGKKWGYKEGEGDGGNGGHATGKHGYKVKETHGSEKLTEESVVNDYIVPFERNDKNNDEEASAEVQDEEGESSQKIQKIAEQVKTIKHVGAPNFQNNDLASSSLKFTEQTVQQTIPSVKGLNLDPAGSVQMAKKRRLKKRKLDKETKNVATNVKSVVPGCTDKEIHIPEESSNKFVIVAAEDV